MLPNKRNTKLTQGNVIKFHFSLTKHTSIPLLTWRQAIARKYEKKTRLLSRISSSSGIRSMTNWIQREWIKKRINRAMEAKNYKRIRIKAIPVFARVSNRECREIIPTANANRVNSNAQNRGWATANNSVSLGPIIKLTRAFAHAASDKIAR